MVIESSQQPVKRGRGRPRKNPLPESTPQKVEKSVTKKVSKATASALSREEELAAFESRSNKSGVLTLLVLLLWIALIGYWMYLKLHQADSIDDDMPVDVVQNQVELPWDVPSENTPPQPSVSNSVVQEYFSRINNWQFDQLGSLQDTSFRTLATLRNYFNTQRLETFAKNITWWIRVENLVENTTDPALQRSPALNPKAYDFVMKYTLKTDNVEYAEPRRVYTVDKWTWTVINGFVYQWTGIAQSPFFQFAKFGIK